MSIESNNSIGALYRAQFAARLADRDENYSNNCTSWRKSEWWLYTPNAAEVRAIIAYCLKRQCMQSPVNEIWIIENIGLLIIRVNNINSGTRFDLGLPHVAHSLQLAAQVLSRTISNKNRIRGVRYRDLKMGDFHIKARFEAEWKSSWRHFRFISETYRIRYRWKIWVC